MLENCLLKNMHVEMRKLLVEKVYVELLCMSNCSMLNYMHDEIMYIEKCVC